MIIHTSAMTTHPEAPHTLCHHLNRTVEPYCLHARTLDIIIVSSLRQASLEACAAHRLRHYGKLRILCQPGHITYNAAAVPASLCKVQQGAGGSATDRPEKS